MDLAHKMLGSDFVSNKEKGEGHTGTYPEVPPSLCEYTEVNKLRIRLFRHSYICNRLCTLMLSYSTFLRPSFN